MAQESLSDKFDIRDSRICPFYEFKSNCCEEMRVKRESCGAERVHAFTAELRKPGVR